MDNKNQVDFDDYADKYESLLSEQLSFFNADRDYFSKYKVELMCRLLGHVPQKILDYGCGIGLSLPHLMRCFPGSDIYATDVSKKSLEVVRKKYQGVTVLNNESIDGLKFDLVFVAGVMHHVPSEYRSMVAKRLHALANPGGHIVIFEHNPFNPVTRRMVATCPFDKGVELISMRKLLSLFNTNSNLICFKKGYCLFFPQILRFFRPLESNIRWLPLGGQYFLILRVL